MASRRFGKSKDCGSRFEDYRNTCIVNSIVAGVKQFGERAYECVLLPQLRSTDPRVTDPISPFEETDGPSAVFKQKLRTFLYFHNVSLEVYHTVFDGDVDLQKDVVCGELYASYTPPVDTRRPSAAERVVRILFHKSHYTLFVDTKSEDELLAESLHAIELEDSADDASSGDEQLAHELQAQIDHDCAQSANLVEMDSALARALAV